MPMILAAPRMARCIGCDSCMLACARVVYRSLSPHVAALQIRSAGGIMGRMVAHICMACADPAPCVEACPTAALMPRTGGRGMTYRKAQCTGCHNCVEACPIQVLGWDERENGPVPCIFCGQCARFCPHACLELVETDKA